MDKNTNSKLLNGEMTSVLWEKIIDKLIALKDRLMTEIDSLRSSLSTIETQTEERINASLQRYDEVIDATEESIETMNTAISGFQDSIDSKMNTPAANGNNGDVLTSAGNGTYTWKPPALTTNETLTITVDDEEIVYDGSEAKNISIELPTIPDIPTIPESLKNPQSLKIKMSESQTITYDGSEEKSVDLSNLSGGDSGSTVVVNPELDNGTLIASISVDGTSKKLYAPAPSTMSVNDRTFSISANNWSVAAPYAVDVTNSAVTADDKFFVDLNLSSVSNDSIADVVKNYAYIDRVVAYNGKYTFYCYSNKPNIDLPIVIRTIKVN